MQIVSIADILPEMSNPVFWGKKISIMLSAANCTQSAKHSGLNHAVSCCSILEVCCIHAATL